MAPLFITKRILESGSSSLLLKILNFLCRMSMFLLISKSNQNTIKWKAKSLVELNLWLPPFLVLTFCLSSLIRKLCIYMLTFSLTRMSILLVCYIQLCCWCVDDVQCLFKISMHNIDSFTCRQLLLFVLGCVVEVVYF